MELSRSKLNSRQFLFVSLLLFSINFILKVLYISFTEIGLDEPFSIFHSQKNLSGIFDLLKTENNPPLYFIFLHYWIKLFGISALSVRLPSVIFSSLSSVLIFAIGNKHFSKSTGIVASLLYTASTLQVFYAHDARVYALFIFLSCTSLYYFFEIINSERDHKSKTSFILFTISNILLCYSHFFGFVVIGTVTVVCLLIVDKRKYFYQCFKSIMIVLLSYIWYLPIVISRFETSVKGTWVQKPIVSDLYTMLWRFSNSPVCTVLMLLILLAAFALNHSNIQKETKNNYFVLLYTFIISYVGLFLISFFIPVFIDRYLLFTSLFYYLLVAISINYIFKNRTIAIILYLVIITLMFATIDLKKGKKSNITELVHTQKRELESQNSILISPVWNDLNFIYHYDRKLFSNTDNFKERLLDKSIIPVTDSSDLNQYHLKAPFALIDFDENNSNLKNYLEQIYKIKSSIRYNGGITLIYFDVKDDEIKS